MIAFWIVATLMATLALAFVVPRLLRGSRVRAAGSTAAARRRLRSLEAAHADGHLDEDEFQRRRRQIAAELLDTVGESPARGARAPITGYLLLVLTPLAAVALYQVVGDPRAIHASPAPAVVASTASGESAQAPGLSDAITQLSARLAQNPEDVDGWFLLGRSYMAVQQFEDARAAFARALELAPGEPALMVEQAEAIAFASGQPRLPAEAAELLRAALEKQPDSQKALWLLGIGAFQQRDFATALDYWQRLEGLLEPGSAVAEQVAGQIAEARAAMGETGSAPAETAALMPEAEVDTTGPPTTMEPASTAAGQTGAQTPAAAAVDGQGSALVEAASQGAETDVESTQPPVATDPALTVEVSLSEELRTQVGPGDVLFVFARAVSGPRVPLAIQRLPAARLPASVLLDTSMAMMPSMSLATFAEVVVGARISKSGSATPQPGDLEALSDPVSSRRSEPVLLHIDKVL